MNAILAIGNPAQGMSATSRFDVIPTPPSTSAFANLLNTASSPANDSVADTTRPPDTESLSNTTAETFSPETAQIPAELLNLILGSAAARVNESTTTVSANGKDSILATLTNAVQFKQDNNNASFVSTNLDLNIPDPTGQTTETESTEALASVWDKGEFQATLGLTTLANPESLTDNTVTKTQSPQYTIAQSLHENGWQAAVNQRIVWMANQQIQSAQLILNPEHLGPIQVHIDVDAQQQTHVQFFAAHTETRQALQDALPALGSLFAQAGIQLGQSQVGSQAERERFVPSTTFNHQQATHDDESHSESSLSLPGLQGQGLINTFA